MSDSPVTGLNEENRYFIVTIVLVGLLIFGPFQSSGLAIRLGYLAVIPALLWVALRYGGDKIGLTADDNDRLNRGIISAIAGMFLVWAYQAATAKFHGECTQTVRDGQGGYECVGDTVMVVGSDYAMALIWFTLAATAFWAAIRRRSS